MTREEIDIMWQQALQDSVRDGEMFTRYHFAKLVAAKEREQIIAKNELEIQKCNAYIILLEKEAAIREVKHGNDKTRS